jgi:hypothetical protein
MYAEVSALGKDLFACHAPVRPVGYAVRKKAGDVSFLLRYKRSECADLLVTLDFGEFYFTLFGCTVSFCLGCGRFIGFGSHFNLCWICESELEAFEEDTL